MKKYLLILILLIGNKTICAQEAFDGHNWQAPYYLPSPKDWGIERFQIPIGFAPQILYHGVEDIRFSPGWAKQKSDEYWTYAFLWYIDGLHKMNTKVLNKNLTDYYTGLYNVNTDSAKVATIKQIPVTANFKKAPKTNGDLQTFTGVITMIDYMKQVPITLNCLVHLKHCKVSNKTIIFYELSPMPFTHTNWALLNQLWVNFTCVKS